MPNAEISSEFCEKPFIQAMRTFGKVKLCMRSHQKIPFRVSRVPHAASVTMVHESPDDSRKQVILVKWGDWNLERENITAFLEDFFTFQRLRDATVYFTCCYHHDLQFGCPGPNWSNFLGRIRSLSIPDSVESLPDKCFYGCENLFRVTFGESSSLKIIGFEAFSKSGILQIDIPDRVEEICGRSFYECQNLSRVTFGESSSLKWIGFEAFFKSAIQEICLPDSVEEIGAHCFYECKSLSRVTFGRSSSLKLIGIGAFAKSGIRQIHIPDHVEELRDGCFCFCFSLSRVAFGESSALKWIGIEGFYYSRLSQIHIPDSVEWLGTRCFWFGHPLSRVTFGASSSLQRIGHQCFGRCESLDKLELPARLTSIGGAPFFGCPLRQGLLCPENEDCSFAVRCGLLLSKDLRLCYSHASFVLRNITIPDYVEELCDMCFYGSMNLSTVTFGEPSRLKRIGMLSFGDTRLTTLSLPSHLESIGVRAFFGLLSLTDMDCSRNSHFSFDNGLLLSKDRRKCYALVGITTDVVIPRSVEEICEECFSESRALCRVTFRHSLNLKRIGFAAFCCCFLTDICIPDSVEEICGLCFRNCKSLSQVTFGKSSKLKRIGIDAFYSSALREIVIPDRVEELGEGCFSCCHKLSRVTFGKLSSLKTISACTFSSSGLNEICVPDSVEELCDECFFDCPYLSRVTFGNSSSLKRVGVGVFELCPQLAHILVPGHIEGIFPEELKHLFHSARYTLEALTGNCQVS